MRFGEVGAPTLTLVQALTRVAIGAAVGTVVTFAILLVLGVVGEEALAAFYADLDVDPLLRSSLVGFLIVAAALGVLVPTLLVLERFAARSELAASSSLPPEVVPVLAQRSLVQASPDAIVRGIGVALVIVGGLVAVMMVVVALTDSGAARDPVLWLVAAGGAAAALVGVAAWRSGGRLRVSWPASIAETERHWAERGAVAAVQERRSRDQAAPDDGPRGAVPRRGRVVRALGRLLGATGVVGVLVFFLSVVLRQQCDGCEPLTWGRPMENAIDVLSVIGGAALLLTGLGSLIWWATATASRFLLERSWRRWADAAGIRRVDEERLIPLLCEPPAADRVAQALGGAAAAALILGLGVAFSAWPGAEAGGVLLAAAAAGFAAVLVALFGAEPARRTREAVRAATLPGDVVAPTQTGEAPSARRRRSRRR